jgi:hypothetical protein
MSRLVAYQYQALYVTMPWWALVRTAEVAE